MVKNYESLQLSLELSRDNHTIDSMSLWKIMQNHPYSSSSKFCHWNSYITRILPRCTNDFMGKDPCGSCLGFMFSASKSSSPSMTLNEFWQPSTIRTFKTLIMLVESTIYTSSSIVRFLGKVTNFGGKGTTSIFLYYLLIKSNFHDDN